MEITIDKVRIKENLTQIEYKTHTFTEDDELISTSLVLKSNAKPHKDFFKVFQNLKKHAINICELSVFKDDKKSAENHVVTSVKIIENMEESKVLISMNKYIKSGKCFSITTPQINLASEDYSELQTLASDIENLKAEAIEFIKGKNGNQQLTLDFYQVVEKTKAA